jgi:hypothetical protein
MERLGTDDHLKKSPYLVYTKNAKSENTMTSGRFLVHVRSPNWSEHKEYIKDLVTMHGINSQTSKRKVRQYNYRDMTTDGKGPFNLA